MAAQREMEQAYRQATRLRNRLQRLRETPEEHAARLENRRKAYAEKKGYQIRRYNKRLRSPEKEDITEEARDVVTSEEQEYRQVNRLRQALMQMGETLEQREARLRSREAYWKRKANKPQKRHDEQATDSPKASTSRACKRIKKCERIPKELDVRQRQIENEDSFIECSKKSKAEDVKGQKDDDYHFVISLLPYLRRLNPKLKRQTHTNMMKVVKEGLECND